MTAEDREIARTAPAWWTGADVSQSELPPLPMPELTTLEGDMGSEDEAWIDYYTDDQMRDYARTALAAERARADAAERDARRFRYLESRARKEGRDGGWVGYWAIPLIDGRDDTPYREKHGGRYHHATLGEAIDAAINAATEGVQHGEAK